MNPAPAQTSALISWLDVPDGMGHPPDLASLGGKAFSLVRLLRAGLPVPPGFVILPAAFAPPAAGQPARFPAPGTPPPGTEPEHPERVPLVDGAESLVAAAYAGLGRRLGVVDPPVAVRSSASDEDLPGASFAGQYATYLGIAGAGEVRHAAERCAASLWGAPVEAYRRSLSGAGKPLPPPSMAVVVQALVAADAAGVAFTADPLSADGRPVVVNASWGLGQSIVDGVVEGDSWRLDRETLVVTQETIGYKPHRTGSVAGGPRVPVPAEDQRRPSLQPAQVAAVARLALQAEAVLGCPADVEWALSGEHLYLLQARPITSPPSAERPAGGASRAPAPSPGAAPTAGEGAAQPLPAGPGTAPLPFEWPEAGMETLHWRLEESPAVVPALPWEEEERQAGSRAGRNSALLLGGERYRRVFFWHGYRYTAEAPVPDSVQEREQRRSSFERPVEAIHALGQTYWEAVVFPEVEEGDRRLAQVDPAALGEGDLAAHLEAALAWYERLWTLHAFALRTIRGGPPRGPQAQGTGTQRGGVRTPPRTLRQRFAEVYRQVTDDAGEEGITALLANVPNKLSEAIDGLIGLARLVQVEPALRHLFEAQPPEVVLERLDRTPGGDTFRPALGALLEEQGLRADAGAFTVRPGAQPGWAEQPALVVALVQRYVPQDLEALEGARAGAVAARDARVAALRAGIADPSTRERFDALLDGARREARAYEDHNYYIDAAAGALLHRALTAAGRRLAGAGAIPAAEDVRWLRLHEITAALRGLAPATPARRAAAPPGPPAPDGGGPRWASLVEARRELHAWQASLTPPAWAGAPPPAPVEETSAGQQPGAGGGAGASPQARPVPPAEVLLEGQPGSAGTATGRVRLIPRDAQVPPVAPGDVLVARNAGALWTPVFPVAAAVVLEEGSLLQHAMLTCREYGVPAIYQARQATSRLQEGQRVTVDGSQGWVLPAPEGDPVP